jgi:mannose-1-phosphate guanylyltransferase
LERAYRRAPAIPIDKAVLARSARVWTLPVRFHWNDVGNWASLAAELGVARGRSRVVDGDALLVDATGNLVWPGGRLVALFGVEGLAVIDAGDAVLVARLDRSAELRRVIAELRKRGRTDLL